MGVRSIEQRGGATLYEARREVRYLVITPRGAARGAAPPIDYNPNPNPCSNPNPTPIGLLESQPEPHP